MIQIRYSKTFGKGSLLSDRVVGLLVVHGEELATCWPLAYSCIQSMTSFVAAVLHSYQFAATKFNECGGAINNYTHSVVWSFIIYFMIATRTNTLPCT
jgi:hypothetical protein